MNCCWYTWIKSCKLYILSIFWPFDIQNKPRLDNSFWFFYALGLISNNLSFFLGYRFTDVFVIQPIRFCFFFSKNIYTELLSGLKYTYFLPVFTEYQRNTRYKAGKGSADERQTTSMETATGWILCFLSRGVFPTWRQQEEEFPPLLFTFVVYVPESHCVFEGGERTPSVAPDDVTIQLELRDNEGK